MPPEKPPRMRLHAHLHLGAGLAEARHRLALQEVHAEVRRDRVEAAAVHDARAGFLRRLLVGVDHAADPLRLAGQVAVVRARLGADLDQRLAVERVRADGRDHDARVLAQPAQGVLVRGIRDQQRQLARLQAERAAQRCELRLGAPGHRPLEAVVRAELLGEVAGEDLADEARRAEDDQVVAGAVAVAAWGSLGQREALACHRIAPLTPSSRMPDQDPRACKSKPSTRTSSASSGT